MDELNYQSEIETLQTQMILDRFQQLSDTIDHIQQFGLSQEYFAWINRNNLITETLGLSIPSNESFLADHPNAIACMEGLGDILKNIWDFIIGIFAKLLKFIKSVFHFLFGSTETHERELKQLKASEILAKASINGQIVVPNTVSDEVLEKFFYETVQFEKKFVSVYQLCRGWMKNDDDDLEELTRTLKMIKSSIALAIHEYNNHTQHRYDEMRKQSADGAQWNVQKIKEALNRNEKRNDVLKRMMDRYNTFDKDITAAMKKADIKKNRILKNPHASEEDRKIATAYANAASETSKAVRGMLTFFQFLDKLIGGSIRDSKKVMEAIKKEQSK